MKPATFEYHAPASVEETVRLLAETGDEGRVLAGGQSLIPMLAMRLAVFPHLVDVGGVPELAGIRRDDGHLVIGATTSQAKVERDPLVAELVPLLAKATPLIGHFQIRNRGTLGGSIANADPAAEYPAVALALDAQLHTASPSGPRTRAAADFFLGHWSTALEEDELLVEVGFPTWTGRTGFAVQEFARRHGDFAIAGAVVGVELAAGDGGVTRCAIGLFGLGPTPLRAADAEGEITGSAVERYSPEEVGAMAMAGLHEVPEDLHGSAGYRRKVGAVMVARAWAEAVKEAQHA